MDCCQQCAGVALQNKWSHLIITMYKLLADTPKYHIFIAPCGLFVFCTLISEHQLELAGAYGIDKD